MELKENDDYPNESTNKIPSSSIKSYVLRQGRITNAQRHALENIRPSYLLPFDHQPIDFDQVFGRVSPRVLEIGFGNGESLLTQAATFPDIDFIGIEVHLPGVGNLLSEAQKREIVNLRIFQHDAVEILTHAISDHSLDKIQIFFPDPWPKRRHRKRRLIQPKFVSLLARKLKVDAYLHCATDWEDYAEQMMKVLTASSEFINISEKGGYFLDPYSLRPVTKFEQRGLRLGHRILDLVFKKSTARL